MAVSFSPLRYPGGKQILFRVLGHLIKLNGCGSGTYAEPYAGGAGAALALLFGGHVKRIALNDADVRIHAFWASVLNKTEAFIELVERSDLTVPEWQKQKLIYRNPSSYPQLAIGFATFFLNRCNRSGIIAGAGPIGGLKQQGKWKIDARFNKADLIERIRRIAEYREQIQLTKLDAVTFIRRIAHSEYAARSFVYLDPPYYEKGSQLYMNHYSASDHSALAELMTEAFPFKWIISYDDTPAIRHLYSRRFVQVPFNLGYSAREARTGNEVLIFNKVFRFPKAWRRQVPDKFITAATTLHEAMPVAV